MNRFGVVQFLLVAALTLAACQPLGASTVGTPTPSLQTSTPLPTPTIEHYTPTVVPTLSPEEAEEQIREMIRTNGGCDLPCWWGVAPRQTTIKAVQSAWGSFASDISPLPEVLDKEGYSITFEDPESPGKEYTILLYTANGVVEKMDTFAFDSLADLLEKYGVPKEIQLHSGGVSMGFRPPSFSLAMLYPEQGIMIYFPEALGDYLSERGTEYVQLCPKNIREAGNPGLYLWSPDSPLSFADILPDIYPSPETRRYELLEDVSNMDEKAFFDSFTNPASSECLKTPAGIWP